MLSRQATGAADLRGEGWAMTFAERIGGLGAGGEHAPLYKQLQRALRDAI
jgi:GntR family transcriptional regulator